MAADNTPLQLRMRVLQLRMDYLSGAAKSQEEERKLLEQLEIAVAQLNAGSSEEDQGAQGSDERRREPRTNASYPAVLRLVRDNGEVFRNLAITRDVAKHGMSLLGVSLVSPFEAKSGEHVTVDLGLPSGVRISGIQAEVRWCTPVWIQPGHYLVGLRFTLVPEEARKAFEKFGR